MPYGPRSYPMVPFPQGNDPLQSLSAIMQIGSQLEGWWERSADRREREAARQRDVAIRDVARKTAHDPAAMAKEVTLIDPERGMALQETLDAKKVAEQQRKQQEFGQILQRLNQQDTVYGKGAQLLSEIKAQPALYPKLRPQIVELAAGLDPRLADEIPETYDEGRVTGMLQFATDAAARTSKMKAGLEEMLPDRNPIKGLSMLFETTDTDEEREVIADKAAYFGMAPEQITAAKKIAATEQAKAKAAAAKAERPTSIASALLDPDLTPARKAELLALERQLSAARREPDIAVDPASVQAVLNNPRLWRVLNPELRGKMLGPLAKAGFNFPEAAEGMTETELERLRVYDLRQLDRERRRVDTVTGDRLMSDAVYADEKARIEDFYRALGGEPEPEVQPKVATPPPAAASRGMLSPSTPPAPERRPIPGIQGGEAELRDGRWIRVK